MPEDDVFTLLGHHTYDVCHGQRVGVHRRGLPGHQEVVKLPRIRRAGALADQGRSAGCKEEVRDVMNTARRIATLLLMEPALDANHERVKQSASGAQAAETLPACLRPRLGWWARLRGRG